MRTLPDKRMTANRVSSATSAQEVMTRNPLSISDVATLREAATFLISKDISAAPVINEAGRPVGAISLADIVLCVQMSEASDTCHPLTVREIMTPAVFFVRPDTPVVNVVEDLLDCAVHRLFVVDDSEVLIGVISALDLLRHQHAALFDGKRISWVEGAGRAKRMLRRHPKRIARAVTTGSDIVMAGKGL